jgi:hypothetical protein
MREADRTFVYSRKQRIAPLVLLAWPPLVGLTLVVTVPHRTIARVLPLILALAALGLALTLPYWSLAHRVSVSEEGLEARTFLGRNPRIAPSDIASVAEWRTKTRNPLRVLHIAPSSGRPHILVSEQMPGFDDLVRLLRDRFPHATAESRLTLGDKLAWLW